MWTEFYFKSFKLNFSWFTTGTNDWNMARYKATAIEKLLSLLVLIIARCGV